MPPASQQSEVIQMGIQQHQRVSFEKQSVQMPAATEAQFLNESMF